MTYEETPITKKVVSQLPKPTKEKSMENKSSAPVAKAPRAIKLSTIWTVLVYTFAAIGVILSVMYVNDIINGIVDSRAEAKVQEILKAQSAAQVAPATELKANQ